MWHDIHYLREEITEELVDVWSVDGLSEIHEDGVHVVDERWVVTKYLYVTLVHLLWLVNLIPETSIRWVLSSVIDTGEIFHSLVGRRVISFCNHVNAVLSLVESKEIKSETLQKVSFRSESEIQKRVWISDSLSRFTFCDRIKILHTGRSARLGLANHHWPLGLLCLWARSHWTCISVCVCDVVKYGYNSD